MNQNSFGNLILLKLELITCHFHGQKKLSPILSLLQKFSTSQPNITRIANYNFCKTGFLSCFVCSGLNMLEKMLERVELEGVMEEFEMLSMDAGRVQRETLKKILEENGETEYLSKWGLNGRSDPESYKTCVPIVTHKEIEPYIRRIADGDASSIITTKPIPAISLRSVHTHFDRSLCFISFHSCA